ncbi:MAG: hypothetical protein EOP56_01155 [Sphingobacteriales bacterium]|nr:MAG: hypothetical protein EOP56_01155 [Sphingobacteriales bacterium]
MTKMKSVLSLGLASAVLFTACNSGSETTEQTTTTETAQTVPAEQKVSNPIFVTEVGNAQDFPNAQLSFGNVTAMPQGDSVKVSFAFNVKNYQLKNQTTDSNSKVCNNSDKGQHIHFILDNKPYVALYEPKHEVVLAKNTEHHLLVFLSRSYHLSLKNKGAAAVMTFKIDGDGKLQKMDNPTTPMVFYSRPKGDYLGKDVDNLLFDFYVWNSSLATDGYKVKANIKGDGVDTTMVVTNWQPYFLKGLPMGKPSITLTLIDKDGNKVNGPETEVTREFNLSRDEPMKP